MDIKNNIASIYPLTPLQQGLLFHTEAESDGAYVVQTAYELRGNVDESVFKKAWEITLSRHPVLRSLFGGLTTQKPVQVILKETKLSWSSYDWKNYSSKICDRRFLELTKVESKTGFKMDRPPLMRFYWLQLEPNVARFVWTYHHALLDGWSVPLVLRDVINCYDALSKGLIPQLPAPAEYRNYINWLKDQDSGKASHYWKNLLGIHPKPTQLNLSTPANKPEVSVCEFEASFDKDITQSLTAFCQKHRFTLNLLCQAGLAILLERYSDYEDIIFGTTVSGRPSEISDINQLIGAFINTLPVKANLKSDKSVISLIDDLRNQQLERDQFSFLPLREIQQSIQKNDGSALFNTLFVFENFPVDPSIKQTLSNLEITRVLLEDKTSYPLTIAAKVTDRLSFNVQFKTSEYQQNDIESLMESYQFILQQMVSNPHSHISTLATLPASQHQKLLRIGQGVSQKKAMASVIHRFDDMANHLADKVALVDNGEEFTYRDLQQKANQLANWLKQEGISSNQRIAICLPSGFKFIASMLAVLKANASYVPIELTQPAERINGLLQEAKVALAITDGTTKWHQTFNWSKQENTLTQQSSVGCETTNNCIGSIAYTMFTSGTTGKPKAISINHDSLANHIDDAITRYSFNSEDRVLQFSSLGFDISVEEIWGSLCSGATLVVYDRKNLALDSFENTIEQHSITTLDLPTAYWHTWVGSNLCIEKLTTLKKIIVGGESARSQALKKWREQLPHVQWFNTYGPTETTIVATAWLAPENNDIPDLLPIGHPIQNVTCFVLDQQQRLTPAGVIGELYIGGMGLSPGYFCRPDLDAKAFINKSINGINHRLYRTGDRVHWNTHEQLMFHGRRDNQVKLRGYRIELTAVENELTQCKGVKQAHAVIQVRDNHPVLVAYVAVEIESKLSAQKILNELRQRLPGYMVPSALALMQEMPLTSNGKIATSQLQPIALQSSMTQESPPTTKIQKQLASYWQEVLGNKVNSIHSNFFELGGDSIHAIKITSLAKQEGLPLQIQQLFESPTIYELASILQSSKKIVKNPGFMVGQQPLSIWQNWLINQNLIEPSNPQILCVKINQELTESQVTKALQCVLQDNECLRSEFVNDVNGFIQRSHPWSDLSSYQEINSSRPFSQQQIQQNLKTIKQELAVQTGTHVINFKTENTTDSLLFLLVFGCHIDETSQTKIQQQIKMAIEGEYETNSHNLDSVQMQNQLRKSVNSGYFDTDIDDWKTQQNNADLFETDQLNQKTLQTSVCLTSKQLKTLCDLNYMTEEEVLVYLVKSTLSKFLSHDTVSCHVLNSTRNDAFWNGSAMDATGDFRSVFPCPIDFNNNNNHSLCIKNFKHQFRKNVSTSLAYLVGLHSHKLPSPRFQNSLLICLTDLDYCDQPYAFHQPWNALGDKSYGGKVRFIKTGDQVQIIWQIQNSQINESGMKELAELTNKTAQIIAKTNSNTEIAPLTSSDFNHCPLDEKSIQTLWDELTIENKTIGIDAIYPVTPLQRGMLFHSVTKDDSAYMVQAVYHLKGDLDSQKLRLAWQETMARHPVLRSYFWGIDTDTPVQVVLKHMDLNWMDENWTDVDKTEINRRLKALSKAELAVRFDQNQAPLMRMYCICYAKNRYQFIWTYHHALLDGWSVPLVLRDVLEQYSALVENKVPNLSSVSHYNSYAQWLQNKSTQSAKAYWQKELKGFSTGNNLKLAHKQTPSSSINEVMASIDADVWQNINQFCQLQQITPNVACQTAWALLINQYSTDKDVVFGTTVSGRSTEIPDINNLVGALINTIPVRVNLHEKQAISQVLKDVRQQQLEREEHSYLPLWEIQRLSSVEAGGSLFDSLLVYENYPFDANMKQATSHIEIEPISGQGDSNFPLTVILIPGEKLDVRLRYTNIDQEVAQSLVDNFTSLLNQVCQLNSQISDIQIALPSHNKAASFLSGPPEISPHKTVPELFQESVEKYKDAPAVIASGVTLTYAQLDKRANELAQYLELQGINEKDVVAFILPRGIQAIVSIVAIQKLGATYLPLDLNAPKSRLEHMLNASGCRFLISNLQHNPKIEQVETTLLLDAENIQHALQSMDNQFIQTDIDLEHPVYINFTSGTQGKPKGVLVPQRAISRLVCAPQYVNLSQSTVMLHASALAFDAATFEIWGALLNGGCLIAYSEEHMDLSKLNQHIQKYNVNTMWLTAGLFQQWVNTLQTTVIPELDYILTGGDVVSPIAVKKLYDKFSNTTVINGYGPTETTTFACCYPIPRDHDWRKAIPIGKPINSTQIKVVDESLKVISQGNAGELLISGSGVALGYLGENLLDAEKFIEFDGQKHFRTGDKVKMENGGIEFFGRIDRQVKIRGFRIELNEIESVISQLINNECIVVAQGDSAGSKKLFAFIETHKNDYQESQILSHIQQHLPDYMVPARIVFLDQFPLTKNGKVDQKRLPQVQQAFTAKNQSLQDRVKGENTNHMRFNIKKIWSNLLAINPNDISDDSHFFESGGDSIVAIQLVAKASEMGINLSVPQIFKNPLLKDMAAHARPVNNKLILDEKHHGNIDLTPIQHWFFEHFSDYPNHWNQSVLLTVPKDLNLEKMCKAIHSLSEHHDLLRARFTQQDNTWQQYITPWEPLHNIKEISLQNNTENWQQELEKTCELEQKSLDICKGQLLQLVHLKLPENQTTNRLHIICHHLIVDGVSWRILLSDLMKAYHGSSRLSKTHSYRQWGKSLKSQMPEFKKELAFWQQQCLPTNDNLHCDQSLANVIADEQKVVSQLTKQETEKLLYKTPLAYNNSVEHTILTATLVALSDWINSEIIRIDLEGHGRNGHADQLDLSNTLGWFTAIYPVRFDSIQKSNLVESLKTVKEQMKSVPQGGVGFGALKYLSQDPEVISQLNGDNKNAISFNYMGHMRNNDDSEFGIATEFVGSGNDPRQKRSHILAFGGIIENERLKLHCHYSEKLHTQEQIQQLLDNVTQNLHALIGHCLANPNAGATPSDFPEYPGIQQNELDQLWHFAQKTPNRGRIQAIGQLTGPQQGMIYHSQMNTQEALYVEQLSYRIIGPLNAENLKMAWQQVINSHDIFRVEFLGLDTSKPFQVIRKNAHLNWVESDLCHLSNTDQERKFKQLIDQDRSQHFDFQNAPLMRLRLCIESESSAILTWTYHHALMDGWSMPLVFKSLFNAYRDGLGATETAMTGPSFRRYLQWLGEQDKTTAKTFWRRHLEGFTSPTPLIVNKDATNTKPSGAQEISRKLNDSVYNQLQNLCKKQGVTLNTICQTAWASLLARYSGEKDVLFAITSSGRPGDIEGINDIVGPFINTLPARIKISEEMELAQMLSQVHMQQANLDKFGYLSLTEIQSESEVPNGVNLFESIFAFENYPIDDAINENQLPIAFEPLDWTSQTNFPLTVIWAPGKTLKLKIQFANQHFDLETVNRLSDHYIAIIEAMARGEHPLRVNLMSEAEQQQMSLWNMTEQPFNTEQCIHQMISKQAMKTPDAVALYYKQQHISYQELEQKSTALAYTLHRRNLAMTDKLIAVCLPRGIEQVVACIGIMKAGGAYLPLDPKWPIERRQKLIKKARATALIATPNIKQELNTNLTVIDPDLVPAYNPEMIVEACVKPNNLAYVIFTSGSTGEPKGVMIEHRSAVNTFIDINQRFNVSSKDRVLAVSALTFDLSVYDLFGVLCCGAAAVLPSDSEATNSQSWARLIEQHKITLWDSVPQLMNILLEEAEADKNIDISSLKTIMMSGDWIPLDLPQRIKDHLPNTSINSLGGATEGSIWSITYPIENQDPHWKSIPYGKPMANQQFYIVDDQDQPCPIGVPGHLYIGGIGVARGYWQDSERTTLQFRTHPKTGQSIYWTGDLARYGEDGTIEFLGRSDFQVKVNGFRIELGEIESALNEIAFINQSVVVALDSDDNKKSLIAYVIADSEDFDESHCLHSLQVKLPRYMVPSAIVRLDKIPLSSNGKVNRKALPKPSEDQLSKEYVAPKSVTEITISKTWKALLKCKQVGINDNFFDLGGHSLLATQMVSRLARTLNIEVPMELVFRMPTVKSLAKKLDELLENNSVESDFEEGEL